MKFIKIRDVKSPSRGTDKSAGIDFYVPNDQETIVLKSNDSVLFPTGIKMNIPQDHVLIAFNKSGVATKRNLTVGACVDKETYVKTNKGLFKVIDLDKKFVDNNEIKILSYDIENDVYSFSNFDGFRVSNNDECVKITFEDNSILIVNLDHKILDDNNNYITIESLLNDSQSISIKKAPTLSYMGI